MSLRQVLAGAAVWCVVGTSAFGQTLIWADEFDGSSLNTNNWEAMIGTGTNYGLPAGWGNNELQYYTGRAENVSVSGGVLHIVAREEQYAGSSYTSARLRTLNHADFLYGRIEARIKIPGGQGYWPAFWMLPTGSPYGGWAASGEIDIMESVNAATTVHGTAHYGGTWPGNASAGGSRGGLDYSQAFHVYAIEWEPDQIRWYVDGILYYSLSSQVWYSTAAPGNDRAPFDSPFHILLNVAIGGNWPGDPNGSTVFPQEMQVDWVRVYSPEEAVQEPFYGMPQNIPGAIQAEDFDTGGQGLAYSDCDPSNQGGAYRPAEGVDIEPSTEGAFDVGYMCPGEWIEYTVNVTQPGSYTVTARVASQSSGGSFRLEFDGVDATGTVQVPATGGWQSWTTISVNATLGTGEQVMRFVNLGGSGQEYNVNWFGFVKNACVADFDHDGDADGIDVGLFLQAYGTQSPTADLSGDGSVNGIDVGLYLQAYAGGC